VFLPVVCVSSDEKDNMLKIKLFVFAVAMMVFIGASHAQDRTGEKSWQLGWTPYLWLFSLDGNTAVNYNTVDIDWGYDDFFDALDFGFSSYTEFQYDRFFLINDTSYFDLGEAGSLRFIRQGDLIGSIDGEAAIDVEAQQWGVKTVVGYRVIDQMNRADDGVRFAVDLFTGVLYNSVKTELHGDLTLHINTRLGTITRTASLDFADTEDWWQQVYGVRTVVGLTDRLTWITTGDIATGYEDHNFLWGVKTLLDYRFHKNWSAYIGYQAVDFDYAHDGFEYGILYQGPYLGVMVHF